MSNGIIRETEDFFAETRMSFGDHIEELRRYLWRAIAGLALCLFLGFILDGIGYATDWPLFPGARTGHLRVSYWVSRIKGESVSAGERLKFGIGVPLMQIIQDPVEEALTNFYHRQEDKALEEAKRSGTQAAEANMPRPIKLIYSTEALALLRGVNEDQVQIPEKARKHIPAESVALMRGVKVKELPEKEQEGIEGMEVLGLVPPVEVDTTLGRGREVVRRRSLTTLSVQEALVVYFKVSLVSGLVIASPWVFWQIWAFVAAGLYPHEKRLVHVYLPMSLGLFLAGVLLCQFFVMPQAVAAMLWFNEWLGMTPDLRLNEWLSFAIWMPVVFGVSFQTPLVMLFLGKLGIVDIDWFKSKRKYAWFIMAIFAAFITPSPDAVSMLLLTIPMCLLYELGIFMIKMSPSPELVDETSESGELIEV